MKYLILITLLFSFTVQAENWLNHSKILAGSKEAHSLKSECERISGEKCFDIGDLSSSVFSEVDEQVDDTSKPIYSKSEMVSCVSEANCDLIFLTKVCTDATESLIKNYNLLEVYCSKWVGYEKKLQKTIAQDGSKLAAFQAQKAIEEATRQKEASIQFALKRIECGKRVIGLLIVRNSTKILTTAQVSQINTTYSPIKSLIETGSLVTAKEYMQAITPDGVLITEADKTDLVAEINKCL